MVAGCYKTRLIGIYVDENLRDFWKFYKAEDYVPCGA